MDDKLRSYGDYPDEGSDFFVDEFGERIELQNYDNILPEDEIYDPDLDTEALSAEEESMEGDDPIFYETLVRGDAIEEKIVEED